MPILQEFSLDLPFVPNQWLLQSISEQRGCTLHEASVSVYRETWKDKRLGFIRQSRCVCTHYERYFERFPAEFWKINVECVKEPLEKITLEEGVCSVQQKFDYEQYLTLDEYQRKKALLEVLYRGIMVIAQKYDFDLEKFDTPRDKIIQDDYQNIWLWKTPVSSPSGRYQAQLRLEHTMEKIECFLCIYEEGTQIKQERLFSELPDEWDYAPHLGQLVWVSDARIVLHNQKHDREWSFSI